MPSPVRRSARGAPPPTKPAPPASTTSSSSLSSNRQDRSTRANNNAKSGTPRSLSSEDPSEPPRRSARSHHAKEEEAVKDEQEVDNDVAEEEEVTRCICGQQEYPGPPLSEAFGGSDDQSDEAGGLFISCDGCSVWQHGGCVGILEDSQVPDKYFCEECKPKLHELHTDSRGQKYSLYQPIHGKTSRKASVSKHGDRAQKEREALISRASTDPATGRRRATMRSKEHDDEEEQIQRAIEESKREVEGGSGGKRNGKRARDDSEDSKNDIKRQRRASEAVARAARTAVFDPDSEEDAAGTVGTSKGKKNKLAVTQSVRQAEVREKEKEREKARAEAAGRRQERAGRRHGDDELADETPKPSNSARTSPPPSSQPASPPANNAPEKGPQRGGPGKKTKKLGNNQYTKNKDQLNQGTTTSPPVKKRPGANNQSGSSGEEPTANGDGHPSAGNSTNKNSPERTTGVKGKFGKGRSKAVNGNGGKHDEPAELTLPNMKRRMDAMAAFIARAQAEMGGDKTPSSSGVPVGGAVQPPASEPVDGKSFQDMSAMEMAGVVSQSISNWHSQFSHMI